jgi:hypothetical protein
LELRVHLVAEGRHVGGLRGVRNGEQRLGGGAGELGAAAVRRHRGQRLGGRRPALLAHRVRVARLRRGRRLLAREHGAAGRALQRGAGGGIAGRALQRGADGRVAGRALEREHRAGAGRARQERGKRGRRVGRRGDRGLLLGLWAGLVLSHHAATFAQRPAGVQRRAGNRTDQPVSAARSAAKPG